MEFITALINTPLPTLFVIFGFIFLFLAIATIKKPIVIDIKPPSNRKLSLILGIILIGVGIYLLTFQTPEQSTENSITATPTVETSIPPISSPQSTLLITDTPLPISTSFFENGCIKSDIWTPTTSTTYQVTKDNCLDLFENGFSVLDDNLLINIQSDSPKTSTIYMPFPTTGIIKFDVSIDTFKSGENGNLAFGLGDTNCKITDGEFIFYRSTDSKIFTVYGSSVLEYGETLEKYALGSTDTLEFRSNKSAFEIYFNNIKVKTGIMPTSNPSFCIGFRFPENVNLTSLISNFSIEK